MTTPTIIFTVGPQGTGKTVYATNQVAARGLSAVQRVNFDEYMRMTSGQLTADSATSSDVKLAKKNFIALIRGIAESRRDVIVDGEFLSPVFLRQVRAELGDEFRYEIRDFTDVPAIKHPWTRLEDFLAQSSRANSFRDKYGGPGLPLLVAELNESDGIRLYEPDPTKPKAVIVDIDGTLALHTHRGPYDTSLYHTDEVEERLAELISALEDASDPFFILFVTGRYEQYREATESWLARYPVRYDKLWMRKDGDQRRDNIVKLEIFDREIRDNYNVIAAFDDRDRVVRMWRRLGLLTLQCAYGDF